MITTTTNKPYLVISGRTRGQWTRNIIDRGDLVSRHATRREAETRCRMAHPAQWEIDCTEDADYRRPRGMDA